jgi:hypothetical protein
VNLFHAPIMISIAPLLVRKLEVFQIRIEIEGILKYINNKITS